MGKETCHGFERAVDQHDAAILTEDHNAHRDLVQHLAESYRKPGEAFDVNSSLRRQLQPFLITVLIRSDTSLRSNE